MKNKATSWVDSIQTGHLPVQEAWKCLSSTIIKKLEYPLTALTLSKKECDKLIRIIKDIGLPQFKICKNFPLDLVH